MGAQHLREEHKDETTSVVHALKRKLGLRKLIGESPAFLREVEKIPLVADCSTYVLILGETGTGKEVFARAIHYLSPRSQRPFVPVNCGAIPVELVENELFGHERSAYTGAASSSPGLIREAEGGTLFLDEVDSLPLAAQTKVLRFLQEKEYRPLGSQKLQKADVRVLAASNVELEKAVEAGTFRRDLFYRLNVVGFHLPPLRQRRQDIPALARHFLSRYAEKLGRPVCEIEPAAFERLMLHDWPGNVRELENVIERSVVLCGRRTELGAQEIQLTCSPQKTVKMETFKEAKARIVADFERHYIESLLQVYRGNVSRAAGAASKNRRAFWELIRKHSIDVDLYRPTHA